MYTSLTTNVGDCIDNNYIKTAFANLEYLNDCVNGSRLQVICSSVDGREQARLTRSLGAEACFELQSRNPLISPSAFSSSPSKKVLIAEITAFNSPRYNDSENPGRRFTDRAANIKCDGEVVRTLGAQELSGSLVFIEFQCMPNTTVELCVQSSETATGSATLQADSFFTAQVCGTLICFEDLANSSASASRLCRYSYDG